MGAILGYYSNNGESTGNQMHDEMGKKVYPGVGGSTESKNRTSGIY